SRAVRAEDQMPGGTRFAKQVPQPCGRHVPEEDAADAPDRQDAAVGAEGQAVDVPALVQRQATRAAGPLPDGHDRLATEPVVVRGRGDQGPVRAEGTVVEVR